MCTSEIHWRIWYDIPLTYSVYMYIMYMYMYCSTII